MSLGQLGKIFLGKSLLSVFIKAIKGLFSAIFVYYFDRKCAHYSPVVASKTSRPSVCRFRGKHINTLYVQSMPRMFCCWVNPQKVVYLATFIIFSVYFLRFIVQNLESGQLGPLQTRPTTNLAHYNQTLTSFHFMFSPWEVH